MRDWVEMEEREEVEVGGRLRMRARIRSLRATSAPERSERGSGSV